MTQKQYQRIKKALILTIISTAIFFLVIGYTVGYLIGCTLTEKESYSKAQYETVTVSSGDKLWTICREYCPDGMDIRNYIAGTMKLNRMDSPDIYPGDKLRLVLYE